MTCVSHFSVAMNARRSLFRTLDRTSPRLIIHMSYKGVSCMNSYD